MSKAYEHIILIIRVIYLFSQVTATLKLWFNVLLLILCKVCMKHMWYYLNTLSSSMIGYKTAFTFTFKIFLSNGSKPMGYCINLGVMYSMIKKEICPTLSFIVFLCFQCVVSYTHNWLLADCIVDCWNLDAYHALLKYMIVTGQLWHSAVKYFCIVMTKLYNLQLSLATSLLHIISFICLIS